MTRTHYPGFIVPHPAFNPSAFALSSSTVSQAGPAPGVPEDLNTTPSKMTLEAGGTMSGTSYYLTATRGGMPGVDGAGLRYRATTETSSQWKGWNPPTSISQWNALDYTTTANAHAQCSMLRTPTYLLLFELADNQTVKVRRHSTAFSWGAAVTIFTATSTYTNVASPTAILLESGRVVVYFFVESGGYAQVRSYYSDNDGATWTASQLACLRSPLDMSAYTPRRLRAAYVNGQAVLVAWVVRTALSYDDIFIQWASADGGKNFSTLDTWTGADADHAGACHDLCVTGGSIYMGYIRETTPASGTGRPYVRRITSPFQPFSGADALLAQGTGNAARWATFGAGVAFSDGDMAICADEQGAIYVVGRDTADKQQGLCYVSFDGGTTWKDDDLGSSSAAAAGPVWWDGQDTAIYPKGYAAAWWQGSMFVAHQFAANPGTADPSLCVLRLGGWSRVEMPLETAVSRPITRASWERTWLPFDIPDNTGGVWTLGVTGTPTITLDATYGGLKIVQGVGEDTTYNTTTAPPGTLAYGVAAALHGVVTSGDLFLTVRAGVAGPNSYTVRAQITSTQIILRDMVAAADIATITHGGSFSGVEVLIHVKNGAGAPANDGKVQAWYRDVSPISGTDDWQTLGTSATLQKGASTTSDVSFGSTTGVSEAAVYRVCYTSSTYVGQGWYGQANPMDLQGRDIGSQLMELANPTRIRAVSGPCDRFDAWQLDTAYTYPVEAIHIEHSPSPRMGWRSTTDGTQQTLVWELAGTDYGRVRGKAIALYLSRINFRTAELWGRDLSNVLSKLCDIDAATGQNTLDWERAGNTIRPDSLVSQSSALSYAFNELVDAHFVMAGAGSAIRRIRANGEGSFYGSGTSQRVQIEFDDLDATEPSSGTSGAIIARDVVVILQNPGAFKEFRLIIPVQDTPTGYFAVGQMVIGHVAVLARPYSWSRDRGIQGGFEIQTGRGGARRVTAPAPARRFVEVGWEEGVDISPSFGTAPTPPPLALYSGGPGVATTADTPFLVEGVYDAVSGAGTPVVYLEAIPVVQNSSTVTTIVSRKAMLYGRIVSESVTRSTILGEEGASGGSREGEVVRVSRVRLEEEL